MNDNTILLNIISLELEIENDNSLNNDQLIILYSATEIAKYSYTYWSDNWKKWASLNNNGNKIVYGNKIANVGGDIVIGDVAGGVAGGVGALAVNLIPGPGQVAYGGAIIGGAVTGSAYVAVDAFLHWLF